MKSMQQVLVMPVSLAVLVWPATASGIKSGQYSIGGVQQICLQGDGTWYGTTFNFGGHWVKDPPLVHAQAAIYGNYQVQGHDYFGYGNNTMTVHKTGDGPGISWYDWYDDMSYQNLMDIVFVFVKRTCDPPFTGENTHAASE